MNLASHQESKTFRGWVVKGKPAYVPSNYQDLSFIVIVAFSEQHFYGVTVVTPRNYPLPPGRGG